MAGWICWSMFIIEAPAGKPIKLTQKRHEKHVVGWFTVCLINVYRSMIFVSILPFFYEHNFLKRRLFIVSLPIWIFNIYSGMWSMVYVYIYILMQCSYVFGSIRIGVFMIQFHGFEYPPNMKDNNPFHAKRRGVNCSVQPPLSTHVVCSFFFCSHGL